ncbi:MAG: phosphatase PAP2 family protein [Oscillospiraceae bacterium]|nr:phosphatase PAP2 family protein [Oscillospiraceae bacterium]
MPESIQAIDFAILDFIQENLRCGFLDAVLPFITRLGNAGLIWIVIALAFTVSKKYRRLGVVMIIGLLVSLVTGNLLLKNLIARPRPFIVNEAAVLIIPPPSDYSFPSGHTFSSFISAVILSMHSKKFAAAAIPLAVVMGFSRLYLYVHFPTDVLAGMLLGIALGIAVFRLCRKYLPYPKENTLSEEG